MQLTSYSINLDHTFYSGCLMLFVIVIYLIKCDFLMKKYPKIIQFSVFIDQIFIFIFACVMLYGLSLDTSTCEFFHDCYEGENDSLLAESYTYEVKGSECPRHAGPLIDSFSDRHSNSHLEMRKTPWSGFGLSTVCNDSPYGCGYLSVDCDSKMKSNTTWHYSTYSRGPHSKYFSSMNTYITQKDENGTDCPQYDDLIIDYLHKKDDESYTYCKGMVICYLCSSITQFCIYKTSKRFRENNVRGKYSDLESRVDQVDDGQRLRGSA